jgi:hypothetical protein
MKYEVNKAKATPVSGRRVAVSDHALLAVELVSVLSGTRRVPEFRGNDVVQIILRRPEWQPRVRLVFRGLMGVTWQREYQPGRGD